MHTNKRELANILGVTEETLTQWQKQGMPIVKAGKGRGGSVYDTVAVLAWKSARDQSDQPITDFETERTRKVKLEADKLALEVAEKRGDLIPAEQVESAVADMVAAFRARILSIPSKLAGPIAATIDTRETEALLTDAIHEALHELSDYAPSAETGHPDGGPSGGPATEADDLSMGGRLSQAQP